MICQHCGWYSVSRTSEDESCPICQQSYKIPGNPAVDRKGHRMPWMMYKLALRDYDTAWREVLSTDEIAIIEAADRANSLQLNPVDWKLGPPGPGLTMEELIKEANLMALRIPYCELLREEGIWALTNPEDLDQPIVMDVITGTMKFYLPVFRKLVDAQVWMN